MAVETKKETHGFQAEVKQLLDLMIHSLYSNKEIFLRELVSNASDAADKLRFEGITDSSLFEKDADLKVWVDFDPDQKTLTVRDNGIGMTRDEVIEHLGTIAKSGTKEFFNHLTGDQAKDAQLIGQFGVGFYASFIVAKQVEVKTRKAGVQAIEGVHWISTGKGEYEISTYAKADRGTEIILHLKDEETDLLNGFRLRQIIKKYSDHVTLPIVMKKEPTPEYDKDGKPKPKEKDEVVVLEDEVVNCATALWTLPKSDIKPEEYKALYKQVAPDFEDPLTWRHIKVEGKLEYTMLLYVPARAPFDLWQAGKSRGLKLYVRRVFIMDDAEQFLPHYLRFIRGIIDSSDLPLNISREILQGNRVIDSMRASVIKRVLGMLEELAEKEPEQYQTFWKEFGQVLKEGPAEDFANKEQVANLLRFSSTHTDQPEQTVSLASYIERMPKDQEKIYYVAADSFNAVKNSPHLEIFRKKGIEVLLLCDRIDEWLMSHLTEYKGKALQSVAKGGLDLGALEDKAEKQAQTAKASEYKDLIERMKKVLDTKVKDIRVSHRLTNSPACIVVDEHDMTAQMERIMKAAGQTVTAGKPILELNPGHMMLKRLKSEADQNRFKDWTEVLFDQAILAEGGQLDDPASFVQRLNSLLFKCD